MSLEAIKDMAGVERRAGRLTSGFTLIELMIVVAIIGILAAIAVPKFADLIRKSKEGAAKGSLGAVRSAISIYYADNEGNFPSDDLASLMLNGKYLAAIPAANAPTYHAASQGVCVGLYTVAGGCRLGLGAPSAYDAQLGPLWIYWEHDQPPMMGVSRAKGEFWLSCQHTDTKGTVWTNY